MIAGRIVDNNIRITCTGSQVIDADKLKRIYRLGSRFIQQKGNSPVIVDTGKNVKLDVDAKKMFDRLNLKWCDLTLVIIQG